MLIHFVRPNPIFVLILLSVSVFPPLRRLSDQVKAARDRKLRMLNLPSAIDPDAISSLSVIAFDLETGLLTPPVNFSEVVTVTGDTVCHFFFADGTFSVDGNSVNLSEYRALSLLLQAGEHTIREGDEFPEHYLDDTTGEVVPLSEKVVRTLKSQSEDWGADFRVCHVVAENNGALLGLVGFPHTFLKGAQSVVQDLPQGGIRTIVWSRSEELLKSASEKLRIRSPILKQSEWDELSAPLRSEKVRDVSLFSEFTDISGLVEAARELGVVGVVSSDQQSCEAADIGFKMGHGGFENLMQLIEGVTIMHKAKEKFESIRVIVVSAGVFELVISVADTLKGTSFVTPNVLLLIDIAVMCLCWGRAIRTFQ